MLFILLLLHITTSSTGGSKQGLEMLSMVVEGRNNKNTSYDCRNMMKNLLVVRILHEDLLYIDKKVMNKKKRKEK